MNIDKSKINNVTCRFEDHELENEFQIHRTEKSWKFILGVLYSAYFLGWLIKLDDVKNYDLIYIFCVSFVEQIMFLVYFFHRFGSKKNFMKTTFL